MGYRNRHTKNKRIKKLRRQKAHGDLRDQSLEHTDENIWNPQSDYTSNNNEVFTSGYGSILKYPASAEKIQLIHEEKDVEPEEPENPPPLEN